MIAAQPARYYIDPATEALLSRTPAPRRALFLDRDGVVNVNLGYVHSAGQTQWLPGLFELCRAAKDAGFLIVVVTNQAGIARGLYSEQEFLDYTRWVHTQFAGNGAPLAATFYCPHHPGAGLGDALQECECRKPKPGMLLTAAGVLGLVLEDCIMIGDSSSDMLAAAAAGVGRAFLLADGTPEEAPVGDEQILRSLRQLPAILQWTQQ